jgi:threonine/homoserine/homoserine lactone efflux protein
MAERHEMAMHLWWLYVTAVFLIAGTPGPNMLHVMVQSIHHGPRRAVFTMAGLMSAVLLCILASALGLGAMLQASPRLYGALRIIGAAYLIWLGIKAWRAPVTAGPRVDGVTRSRPGALYAAGLGTGLSNPKLMVFAAAFFPQFLDPSRPFWLQLGILVATFVVIEGGWYTAYALGGRTLARWLAPEHRQRRFNRATGTLFLGFGGLLLAARA